MEAPQLAVQVQLGARVLFRGRWAPETAEMLRKRVAFDFFPLPENKLLFLSLLAFCGQRIGNCRLLTCGWRKEKKKNYSVPTLTPKMQGGRRIQCTQSRAAINNGIKLDKGVGL